MNEWEDRGAIESFAAELIDRFGKLPAATENLLRLIEIKMYCMKAGIAKIDVGPRGALVSFHNDSCPTLPGLLAYVERLNGVAKLRPDSKLVINRTWKDPHARITGRCNCPRAWQRRRRSGRRSAQEPCFIQASPVPRLPPRRSGGSLDKNRSRCGRGVQVAARFPRPRQ